MAFEAVFFCEFDDASEVCVQGVFVGEVLVRDHEEGGALAEDLSCLGDEAFAEFEVLGAS